MQNFSNNGSILYIHGFASSGASEKGQLLKAYFEPKGVGVLTPDLPVSPKEAIALLTGLIDKHGVDFTVGSSQGGFYSYYLAHYHGIPGVQINPLTQPERMRIYSGKNTNHNTGEEFTFTEIHILELETILHRIDEKHDENLNLFLSQDDEVIDVPEAKAWYQCARSVHTFTGKFHRFSPFQDVLPLIESIYNGYKTGESKTERTLEGF